MGSDDKKRQKKLERKSAKRKEKKHQLVREQSAGLSDRLTAAAKFPVLDCLITDALEEQGLGWVILSRELSNGRVAVGTFLVDRYCLGVKNAVGEVLGRSSYDEKYRHQLPRKMPAHPVTAADALKLLQEAVAYAHNLGLSAHPDYPKVLPIFGSTNAAESTAQYEFGKDGKPFFISGPNDTPARIKQIMSILAKTRGPGQYDFLAEVKAGDSIASIMPAGAHGTAPEDLDEDADDEE